MHAAHPPRTRTTCRVCGSSKLVPLFSLGEQFVSDFVDNPCQGIRCPIDLELCKECTLVQLKHTAPQELLYTRHYWYRSGVTDTMKKALRDVTRTAEMIMDLQPGDVVLDIGSNDGSLLRSYEVPGLVTVGVEPATNLAEEGRRGISHFINDFWSFERYEGFPPAKGITAIGMFYDLEEPGAFIRDVSLALDDDGLFIAQLMCLKNMIALGDIGNFAHEHLEFYSLKSLDRLFGEHGLEIVGLDTNNVNGESYRLFIQHKRRNPYMPLPFELTKNLRHARKQEAEWELDKPATFKRFYQHMEAVKAKVAGFIQRKVESGKRVWVYGASTKGNVILQYMNLDAKLIHAAADRSPEKWGKFTIGTGIPIESEANFRMCRPDYALMLPYAFEQEFLKREVGWLMSGGKFIIPLPVPRVIGVDPVDMERRAQWSPPDRLPQLLCEAL